MIALKPNLRVPDRQCPDCGLTLTAKNFLISGMRNLADFRCENCQSDFFGDLPSGQALYTPILLNKKNGTVSGGGNAKWFSDWLADSYKNRSKEPLGFKARKLTKVKSKIILLNCLDTLYGHSLLKLLNAQRYIDFHTDFSLIVILPPFLEWLLPDGVAEAWIVDLSLRCGTEWNDWLANEINKRLAPFSEVCLSKAFSHPHPKDFDIKRFTRIKPFPLDTFVESEKKTTVTFIWREDRLWETSNAKKEGLFEKLKRFGDSHNQIAQQTSKVINFAEFLRKEIPHLDFAVAGIGKAGNLPAWITDLRFESADTSTEITWCQRYAKSHLVVGVHGSNMLLPSAHAGGLIELIGEDRQGNFLQDILLRTGDAREILFLNRFVPLSTAPENLARIALTMLRFAEFRYLMSSKYYRH